MIISLLFGCGFWLKNFLEPSFLVTIKLFQEMASKQHKYAATLKGCALFPIW